MVATHPPLEDARRAVRWIVCRSCAFRPHQSELLGPEEPRACEPGCQVFLNMPRIMEMVATTADKSMVTYERIMRDRVCAKCQSSETSGDYCGERSVAHCPLSMYARDVVSVIERLPKK
ncbi:MAG: hypothetical protein GC164_01135 [Phycisphaera sp.]|nr:hypothetical protein [Phycisphaera sp.]